MKNPRRTLFTISALVVSLGLKLSGASAAQTNDTAIPFSQIGAVASQHYTGEGLSIVQSAEGASLRCVFQKLEGRVNCQGLWLTSEAGGSNSTSFRVISESVGRERCMPLPLDGTGKVETLSGVARFERGGLDEEYTVSVDGIRQDFIVTCRPAGNGELCVNLAVDGARAEALSDGARLVLDGSSRKLAYNHLKVTDAHGRELTARMEVVSPNHLAVVVDDANAGYPVRIDPTFSDANWISLVGLLGASSFIKATVMDTKGNIYVGGFFTTIGSAMITNIAKWNGANWSALGSGVDDEVCALACDGSGKLYVGGIFSKAGGVSAKNIAKWNGTNWVALGSGINNTVLAVGCDSSGNLFAGGYFTSAGSVSANNIAKWNGANWSALGSGVDNDVLAFAFDGFGNLYVGGFFSTAGGVSAAGIAKWNGITWSPLGTGVNGDVFSLGCDKSGKLYAGGSFTFAGSVSAINIAKWNGTNWYALGAGAGTGIPANNDDVVALALDGSGNLYAGGHFTTAGGISTTNITKWNGSTWSPVGSGMDNPVYALACDSAGSLYPGGLFPAANGLNEEYVAKWNGNTWLALGSGYISAVIGQVNALCCDRFGNLYVESTDYPARTSNIIAEWNGYTWSILASGMEFGITALACDKSGNLYAGGLFETAGGVSANNIAKWNGSAWSCLGSGIDGFVYALAFDKNWNLYAGGYFWTAGGISATNIAKWNGTNWSSLGLGVGPIYDEFGDVTYGIYALACDKSGNLFAGGYFETAGSVSANNIAKWNGSAWSSLGSGGPGAAVPFSD